MNDVSLREYLDEKFKHQDERIEATNRRLDKLTCAIEEIGKSAVSPERFESAYHNVRELQKCVDEVDSRVEKVEGYIGAWRYIGGAIVAVIIAIVIAWLRGQLGI